MDLAIGSYMSQDINRKEHKLIQELVSMSVSASKHKVDNNICLPFLLCNYSSITH